ncbi:hypothetical protein LELG_01218 [Lodderomyces elongisporus NRRL YB-4239]|uniref:Choline transport protein n=1 Tax=Lodderomyces elongisporus (strain ATCC 11503 / CBS 2605 / JCM 1781 / NBRC 1676 / NRRL YB-4239) TaxID=379508 RepID=A5DV32_LODEL|nr:hypothetical protein LELG_01218 [Lodderomyces elongisporus NRRL YB-4239]
MSDMEKKLSSPTRTRQSVEHGEIDYLRFHGLSQQQTHIRNLDSLALNANDKDKSRLLKEAQANLEFVADTGYAPELRRDFSFISLLGLGFGITNSWFGISGSLIAGISSGGPMMIIYGIIIVASVSMCIAITLSEMASAYPNASGQIYWTMKLAPAKYSKLMSYITGMLSWLGSIFTSASVTMTIATAVVGMYMLHHPNDTVERWQVFIVYEIVNVLLVFFNIWEKPLPMLSSGTLYVSLFSFAVIIIVVLSMHEGDFQSSRFVFVEFENGTGWSSSGIAFIVGLINPNWSFSCLDAATHIAEESLNPGVQIPQAIISTVIVGFITSFSYCIAMFFSIKDLSSILSSNTGVPIMDIFYQATNSKAAAVGLEVLILLTAIGCNIGCHTWQARIGWSFARDNGLPFSKYWSKINSKTGTPVNAHVMSCFWVAIIGCIYLGSSTAFNSILVSCVTFLLLSYFVPTIFFIFKRNQIKRGPFFLLNGVGLVCNIVLCCWATFAFIFYNFPSVMPVSGGNMNYSSAVFGVALIICFFDWILRGRREYIGLQEREGQKEELTEVLSNQLSNIEMSMSHK